MGNLTERDILHWNAKLSAATRRKVGGIFFLIGAALFAWAYFSRLNNGLSIELSSFGPLYIPILGGGATYVSGFAVSGTQKKYDIFIQAWNDINTKLFSDFEARPTKTPNGFCAYEILVGSTRVISYMKHWTKTYHSDGKSHKRDQYACLCDLYATSPTIQQVGCEIRLTRDTRETGSMYTRASMAAVSAIGTAFGKLFTLGRTPAQPIQRDTVMDNLEFEQRFDVETDDNVRCRMYLTQKRMERLVDTADLMGRFMGIYIDQGQLHYESSYLSFFRSKKNGGRRVLNTIPSHLDIHGIADYRQEILAYCHSIQCLLEPEEVAQ